jgi:hypothetical protein
MMSTMPTQKTFKGRVRTRMAKTGESYTTARQQLLRKAGERAAPEPPATTRDLTPALTPVAASIETKTTNLTSDDAMARATGRHHADWFALLDAWGATDHAHAEIARWLQASHGVAGWWSQNITVAYERARGMRAPHELTDGFSVSISRTVATDPADALAAFTDAAIRRRWLTDATMHQRQTRATNTARFDWADPPSILVVYVTPKGPGKTTVTVTAERLPDADAVARLKASWRTSLGQLKTTLEGAI